ncbi:SLATT domain-containing protein [Flagellimonas sp. S3867]|uniref:SLATT domain-containing protein n=1 Tax=Flagellimonas sp. S3867 TaxID=2768063 RepID=UPI001682D91D|nr:SLATT domain-containing protein [Flagellimonas sp. S3867]
MVTEKQKLFVIDMTRRIHTLEFAHRFESKRHERRNIYFGTPPIILGALITIQFWSDYFNILNAVIGCLISILVGLQTYLKPSEIAEKHRKMSETYDKLRHRLEYLMLFEIDNPYTFTSKLNEIKKEWDNLDTMNVPYKIYREARAQTKKLGVYPGPQSYKSID